MTPPFRTSQAALTLAVAFALLAAPTQAQGLQYDPDDPRIGLRAGWTDAGEAASGMELMANLARPGGFYNAQDLGDMNVANSDLAFTGDRVVVGNFNGFKVYDVSDPMEPSLLASVLCPGGQGDVSVHGDLLFMSVEQTRGRLDCGVEGAARPVDPERFRGVRIFDISDVAAPRQVAAVQTCRGSHTHTLVPDPNDEANLYVYVSGASFVRPNEEMPGCSRLMPEEDPETSLFQIEVIRVPLAAPQDARIVAAPRVFADAESGRVDGLWAGGTHGEGTQRTAVTNHCHDITAYPELGIAAGACSGNGILLDIRDPANPVRIDEVSDPNFAYWHSATFSNDGTKVIFTDEWGGGMAPRCRATDPAAWGANAIYELVDGRLQFASHYKLPVPQTDTENCVAHNGSLVPVPGRDIKVQAWYQGGISVFDFTDPANPHEIAFFDRGPLSETDLHTGGYWSAYWHNGYVYGAEIARGLDVLRLVPSEHLSASEIEAARLVRFDEFNPQTQLRVEWPAEPVVARAYVDQLERAGALPVARLAELRAGLDRAERDAAARPALGSLASALAADADAAAPADAARLQALASTLSALAAGS